MLHTRWSPEAWSVVRVEFRRALALRSEIRRVESFNGASPDVAPHLEVNGPAGTKPGRGCRCNTYSTVRLLTVRLRPRKLKYLVFRDISTLAFRLHSLLPSRNP